MVPAYLQDIGQETSWTRLVAFLKRVPWVLALVLGLVAGAAVVVDAWLSVGLIAALLVFIISFRYPGLMLSATLAMMLLYRFQMVGGIQIASLQLSMSKLAAGATIMLFMGQAIVNGVPIFKGSRVFWALLSINVAFVIGVLGCEYPEEAMPAIPRMAMLTLMAYMIYRFCTREHLRTVMTALPLIMAGVTILSLSDLFLGGIWSQGIWVTGGERITRSSGTFEDPNLWATVNLTLLPLLIFQMRQQAQPALRLLHLLVALGAVVNVVLSYSRAGLLTGVLLGLLYLWEERRHLTRTIGVMILMGVVAVAVVPSRYIVGRMQTLISSGGNNSDGSVDARYNLLLNGFDALSQNVFLGVGPGQFGRYVRWGSGLGDHGKVAHNSYLSLAVELGLGGMLAFAFLAWVTVMALRQAREYLHEPWLLTYLAAARRSFFAFCLMAFTLNLETTHYAWFLLGLTLSLSRLVEEEWETQTHHRETHMLRSWAEQSRLTLVRPSP